MWSSVKVFGSGLLRKVGGDGRGWERGENAWQGNLYRGAVAQQMDALRRYHLHERRNKGMTRPDVWV